MFIRSPFIIFCGLILFGCTVHDVRQFDVPCVEIAEDFYHEHAEPTTTSDCLWWHELGSSALNDVVEAALQTNLELGAAWWRLAQAEQEAIIKNAPRYPSLEGFIEAETKHSGILAPGIDVVNTRRYLIGGKLSYEIDLWRKIDSQAQAAGFQVMASEEDVQATALVLTGKVVDLWLTIQEQKALLNLIESQIELNQRLLEVVELRFSLGHASALDVFQQRLQLAETATQAPPLHASLEIASDQLEVLLGETPSGRFLCDDAILIPPLPPFPCLGQPIDLISRRPDLREKRNKLYAADYEVAAAVADCFPKLTLSVLYEMRANSLGELIEKQMVNALGGLVMPLIDGGKRRAEANKKRAVVCEKWLSFGQSYLSALLEVEEALVKERYQQELLVQLLVELDLAKRNLLEARYRYASGLVDYLPVVTAIQSLQRIERRVITEQKALVSNRARLYRALGGCCLIYSDCGEDHDI